MKLSPLELRKHQFTKKFRFSGYEPEEVDGFVRQMADQWAEVLEENRRMEDRVGELEGKLSHYEKVELALQEALETARHTARQVEDNAERKAKLAIEEAELRAQRMLQDAEQKRYSVKQDLVKLNSRQTEIAARMRAFLMAEMEVLAQFQGDDPSGFIRLVAAGEPSPAGVLPEAATQPDALDADGPDLAILPDAEEKEVFADEASVEEEQVGVEAPPVEESPPAIETPVSAIESPPVEESIEASELPAVEEQADTDSPQPVLEAEIDVSDAATASGEAEVSDSESFEAPYPPVVVPPPPPPVSEAFAPLESPEQSVEEPIIVPPRPEPVGLPTVEELMAETLPPPPPPASSQEALPKAEDVDFRPTYGEVLSEASSEPSEETKSDPFSSSFFASPFSKEGKPDKVNAPEPVPGSDLAQPWSLRSLVTGDGDSEPTTSGPTDAERERIRRILEDLD